MNFTKSIEVCFNKFANFEGRASKSEFWWFQLFCIIVQIVGTILDSSIRLHRAILLDRLYNCFTPFFGCWSTKTT